MTFHRWMLDGKTEVALRKQVPAGTERNRMKSIPGSESDEDLQVLSAIRAGPYDRSTVVPRCLGMQDVIIVGGGPAGFERGTGAGAFAAGKSCFLMRVNRAIAHRGRCTASLRATELIPPSSDGLRATIADLSKFELHEGEVLNAERGEKRFHRRLKDGRQFNARTLLLARDH